MGQTLPPVKAALRTLLLGQAERLGLTPAAVNVLVDRARMAWLRDDADLLPPDTPETMAMIVCGAAMVRWCPDREDGIAIQIAGPGQLVTAGWDDGRVRTFRASALVPTVVARFDRGALCEALDVLPPERRLHVVAYAWRVLSRLVADAAQALALPLETRVVRALERLAVAFGAPHAAGGTEIRLRLRTADLAALVTATRPNVSRCLAALRRTGVLRQVDGWWVLPEGRPRVAAGLAGAEACP